MNNWESREKRAEQAKKHTKKMQDRYALEIADAIRNTVTYGVHADGDFPKRTPASVHPDMHFLFEKADSVGAVMRHASSGKCAVLNFASYKNPGGGFINGSKAQEECLCHESFLYNVLREKEDYYEWNNLHKNRSLYENRALYTPDVAFERDGKSVFCDVITCAAPNYTAAKKYGTVSRKENEETLESRVRFVLDIAAKEHVETLILGAFGCGVFGQDPKDVGRMFSEYLQNYEHGIINIIFAVIPRDENTFDRLRYGVKSYAR